jgi:hypothetical protein
MTGEPLYRRLVKDAFKSMLKETTERGRDRRSFSNRSGRRAPDRTRRMYHPNSAVPHQLGRTGMVIGHRPFRPGSPGAPCCLKHPPGHRNPH